jgi:hypothetical protein
VFYHYFSRSELLLRSYGGSRSGQANTVERLGVAHSGITISYRFSHPDEPAGLVFPHSHRLSNRNPPPEELNTGVDHFLRDPSC